MIAIDQKEAITQITKYVCRHHPHVHVIARAYDRMHVYHLWSVGCRDIIRETYDSSIRAGRSALEALGVEYSQAVKMMESFEDMDRKMMVELADLYDVEVPLAENKAFLDRFHELRDGWERELKGKMS